MKKNPISSSADELRRLAEEKLSKSTKKSPSVPATKAELQRLLYELQVHQIELEMQNEELTQSRKELESTLNMYTELYAFASVGYFTLTRDGTIRRVNLTGAKLMGAGLSDLIKRRFGVFVSSQSRAVFSAFLDKVFASSDRESCEVALEKEGSAPFWVHIDAISESSLIDGEMCYAIVIESNGHNRQSET